MVKRILAILLTVSMITAIVSCSGAPDTESDIPDDSQAVTSAETETEVTTASYYETLGERNFDGDTFTILDANWNPAVFTNIPDEAGMTGEPINDSMYARDMMLEEKYGVNIEYIQIAGNNNNAGCTALDKEVRAGGTTYDIAVSLAQGGCFEKLAMDNILYNLLDAPYLSLQSPWWSKLIHDNLQYNNKLFYTGGDIMPTMADAPAVTFVNLDLLNDYGIENNLYELVFDGKWTIDVLAEIIKDKNIDVNQDGSMEALDDFFGLVSQYNTLTTNGFCASLGMNLSTEKSDGDIVLDLDSELSVHKIELLTDLIKELKYTDQEHIIDHTFRTGNALFLSHYMISLRRYLREMEDNYGILPMAKYDEKQESYISFVNAWTSGFVAIPQTANVDKSAFLMEAMAYASYELIRPNIYEVTFKDKISRDSESARIIDIIIETCYLDLNSIYNFGGSLDIIRNTIIDKTPFISSYEKQIPAIQKAIDDFKTTMQ